MADDSGDVLRRSLDAVDRNRKLLMGGLVFLAVMLVLTFFYGTHAASNSTVDAILAHFFLLVIWVTGLTLFVMMQISAMTKRILRAIDLASRK